jgi:uncharacterized tellurite resistance protein B-like protein
MIDRFKSMFAREAEVPAGDDIQLAAAALMVEVMRSDNDTDPGEINRISVLLGEQFDLNQTDTQELMDLANGKIRQSISLLAFTRKIRSSWNNQERVLLLQHLWSIAYADGKIDAHERHVIRKIGALLYMTERQMYAAKERARKEMSL